MGGKRGGGAKGAAAAVSAHSDSLSLSPPLRIRSPPPPPRRGGPAADQATGQDLRPQDRVYSTTNSGLSLYIQIYGPLPVLARRAAAALRALSRRPGALAGAGRGAGGGGGAHVCRWSRSAMRMRSMRP
eukprot:3124866-Rhodomonas_salina.1